VVEDALGNIPQGLHNTYIRILERIDAQSPYMRELALDCFCWMIYGVTLINEDEFRPKTTIGIKELLLALATRSGDDILSWELDPPDVIFEASGNLLERRGDFIYPIHYTVQDFLRNHCQEQAEYPILRQLSDRSDMHARLATAYLRLLLNRVVKLGELLFEDAISFFDYHISQCDVISPQLFELLEETFRGDTPASQRIIRGMLLERYGYRTADLCPVIKKAPYPLYSSVVLYSTRLYNNPQIRQRWLPDSPPPYALHLASTAGLPAAVDQLLDAGCDIHERFREVFGATPLILASIHGHFEVVQTLIKRGANVNAWGGEFKYPLNGAACNDHVRIVKLLLESGANVRIYDAGTTQLRDQEIVQILREAGANVKLRKFDLFENWQQAQ